jgi:hypothetical protein
VWSYTPRQAASWLALGHARQRAEAAERLMIAAMGAQSKSDAVTKQMRQWTETD